MIPHTWVSRPQARCGGSGDAGGGGSPEGKSQGGGGSGVQQFQGREWFGSRGAGYGRNDAFWAGVVWAQRKGLAFSAWVTRHQPQLAPSAPPQPGVSSPQLDGNSFSASMVARATCSARDGRQLVLLTPSPRVARPAENRGVGRPRRHRATTGFQ